MKCPVSLYWIIE